MKQIHVYHLFSWFTLTILLYYVFARSYEISKALILVAGHCTITSFLQGKVLLKMGVKMLLEFEISHESHAANVALKFNSLENFILGC